MLSVKDILLRIKESNYNYIIQQVNEEDIKNIQFKENVFTPFRDRHEMKEFSLLRHETLKLTGNRPIGKIIMNGEVVPVCWIFISDAGIRKADGSKAIIGNKEIVFEEDTIWTRVLVNTTSLKLIIKG